MFLPSSLPIYAKNGNPKNPIIRNFYQKKCKSKVKMTDLSTVMHKICSIVFAMLRDEKRLALITLPQEYRQRYQAASI